ncbi:Uu.00g090720.m01.CDS01 [Anthostomella pinea]|uniref:Uu.00g090720.m01.CDS01 n=1 Tax=Anthostomella pinea TaxID=933095 RepID=A0AAI8VNW3_9PEZI|nr:Uu.00g090720.m01.CDS01 [Anthostomella pinea]
MNRPTHDSTSNGPPMADQSAQHGDADHAVTHGTAHHPGQLVGTLPQGGNTGTQYCQFCHAPMTASNSHHGWNNKCSNQDCHCARRGSFSCRCQPGAIHQPTSYTANRTGGYTQPGQMYQDRYGAADTYGANTSHSWAHQGVVRHSSSVAAGYGYPYDTAHAQVYGHGHRHEYDPFPSTSLYQGLGPEQVYQDTQHIGSHFDGVNLPALSPEGLIAMNLVHGNGNDNENEEDFVPVDNRQGRKRH